MSNKISSIILSINGCLMKVMSSPTQHHMQIEQFSVKFSSKVTFSENGKPAKFDDDFSDEIIMIPTGYTETIRHNNLDPVITNVTFKTEQLNLKLFNKGS